MVTQVRVRSAASITRQEVRRILTQLESLSKYPSTEDVVKHLKELVRVLDRFLGELEG
ncbi:MAG: hypothetical protein QN198_02245 [Armatimonadota bacterium]|jgi:hypothetical protein|nr:hypothetical protein [Armatimonadota bacterium]MDR5702406.1 hypothetical protein [Armatimonadota bacterium]MDR7435600.1 hypothetical protein [Armatimonadota bacterium]